MIARAALVEKYGFWRREFWSVSPAWKEPKFRKRFFWVAYALIAFTVLWRSFCSGWAVTIDVMPELCIPGARVMLLDLHGFGSVREFERGMVVSFKNQAMQKFFPKNYIYAKYVAGVQGDHVVVKDGTITVNGKEWGKLNLVTLKKLPGPMSSYDKDFIVGKDELLMLGTHVKSYDGRYWGVVHRDEIIGRAYPIF